MNTFFIKIYHKVLNLFFEFDVGIYAVKITLPKIKNIKNLKYDKKIIFKTPEVQSIKNNNYDLSPEDIKTYVSPSLLSSVKIRDLNSELNQSIKIKEENLQYLCIAKNYNIGFDNSLNFKNESFVFVPKKHKSLSEEICISRSLRTIEEILELEPYTYALSLVKFLKLPVVKHSVKKTLFTKEQLDLFRTKLAVEAKCKKYSITVEEIFDKIPAGLYSEIELTKENTIYCTLAKEPQQLGELQFLVTGKRKYDTQTTKAFVNYSEIDF